LCGIGSQHSNISKGKWGGVNIKITGMQDSNIKVDRNKNFVHFKGFNISQKPKSSPLSYFAQKTRFKLVPN
jgi:hypothetical protein